MATRRQQRQTPRGWQSTVVALQRMTPQASEQLKESAVPQTSRHRSTSTLIATQAWRRFPRNAHFELLVLMGEHPAVLARSGKIKRSQNLASDLIA